MNRPYLRIIGDIHNELDAYRSVIGPVAYSVQVGDFGITSPLDVDATRHKVIAGNHENYGAMKTNPEIARHYLGDFGRHSIPLRAGQFDFFYVRGAYSVDRKRRFLGIGWWEEEQLTWPQGYECVNAYRQMRPRTMITHDCPEEICYLLGVHTRLDWGGFHATTTHQILQNCFDSYKPELWVFGHHHCRFRETYKGTVFIGLDGELPKTEYRDAHFVNYLDFDEDGHLLTPLPVQRHQ